MKKNKFITPIAVILAVATLIVLTVKFGGLSPEEILTPGGIAFVVVAWLFLSFFIMVFSIEIGRGQPISFSDLKKGSSFRVIKESQERLGYRKIYLCQLQDLSYTEIDFTESGISRDDIKVGRDYVKKKNSEAYSKYVLEKTS
jgi:hypothetical protein